MAYHAEADIRAVAHTTRVTELGDADKDGTIDSAVLAAAIATADARVFSALKPRYPSLVPSAMTPGTTDYAVRTCAATFALWQLAAHQFRGGPVGSVLIAAYDEWKKWLELVNAGTYLLGDHATALVVSSTTEDRRRVYRERGPLNDLWEPAGGADAGMDNDFFQSDVDENATP